MAIGQISLRESVSKFSIKKLHCSYNVNCGLSIRTPLFFRQNKIMRMKTDESQKAASPLPSTLSSVLMPLRCSRTDFPCVFGCWFVPTFPWANPDRKGGHPNPHCLYPKAAIYSGDLEGSLSPAGPFLLGTSTSENNTSTIYARGPVMTSSTRID